MNSAKQEREPSKGPQLFSTTDFAEQNTSAVSLTHHLLDHEQILDFLRVSECIEWVEKHGYTKVALQFPDHLLPFAVDVYCELEEHSSASYYILADTSYRSCCVDQVAAAHASCDALIHFGDACLTVPPDNIAVKYIYGDLSLDIEAFESEVPPLIIGKEPVILLTDAPFSQSLEECEYILKKLIKNEVTSLPIADETTQLGTGQSLYLGRIIPSDFAYSTESSTVVFVGHENSQLLPLFLLSFPYCGNVVHFHPEMHSAISSRSAAWKGLRARLHLLERLRDSKTIGVVVGTTGIKGHREAVERLRKLGAISNKTIYVLSVGKINLSKLSNFGEIDAFVLLSCPFGLLLETHDFFRPVVSMFEAEMAFNPNRSWLAEGSWTAEFAHFLNEPIGNFDDGERVDVSLITGRIRIEGVQKSDDAETAEGQVTLYSAGDYLKERSWKGLDDAISIEHDSQLHEGRSGVAASYANEQRK